MKRVLFLSGFLLFSFAVFCQNVDSLAVVREVDSLIQVVLRLVGQNAYQSLGVNKSKFDEALKVITLAEDKTKSVFGTDIPLYAICLYHHGRILANTPQSAKSEAELYFLNAKSIWEKTQPKEHSDYAAILTGLGHLYSNSGNFEASEFYYNEATDILKKSGVEYNKLAQLFHDIGWQYIRLGEFQKAESSLLESASIREKQVGKNHLLYAWRIHNLGELYLLWGRYKEAESYLIAAKQIREKIAGNGHLDYSWSLFILGRLYTQIKQYQKAEIFYLEAKNLREKLLGKEHPLYAATLQNLGELYFKSNQFDHAEKVLLEAQAMLEKVRGKEDVAYGEGLIKLAALYLKTGHFKSSEQCLLEAVSIFEKHMGHDNMMVAWALSRLGDACLSNGLFNQAEIYYVEAVKITENVVGKEYPGYSYFLMKQGNIFYLLGKYQLAETTLIESSYLNRKRHLDETQYFSENELLSRIFNSSWQFDLLLTITGERFDQAPDLIKSALNNALFYKGFLLENALALKRMIALAPDTVQAVQKQWNSIHRQISFEYAKPILGRNNILELESKADSLEKLLVRSLVGFADKRKILQWEDLNTKLNAAEAAIEFIKYSNLNQNEIYTRYVALLSRPDWDAPRFIPLFEEKALDSLLQTPGERRADYVNSLYSLAERGATPLGKPQKSLYELLWKPLEKELAGVKTIYFSPSGLLHRLNLAAILINLDSVLGDQYNLVELGSTRQLVIPAEIKLAANDAQLFGGIHYDSDSTAIAQANAALDSIDFATRGELSFAYTDSTLRVGVWTALPFTDREVGSVENTLKSAGFQTYSRRGYVATEEAFKSIGAGGKPSPRVLHIATHGFFFPDPAPQRGEYAMDSPLWGAGGSAFKISDHPMIRSGLLLAGANHAWQTGKPIKEGMEDGILTAYEISQMNLSNTELVVLSACETGLGDIQGNEGVYGLQRAFKIAGAKYLIMSLWQVPDKQTSLLMTTFYKKWLEEKMAIPEAFRAAQKELREAGLDPYQWAGFVLVE